MNKRKGNRPTSETVSAPPSDQDAPSTSLPDDIATFFADLPDEKKDQILLAIIRDRQLSARIFQLMYEAGMVDKDFLDVPEDTKFYHFLPLFKG